jgi:hypothetical protein
MIQHDLNEVFTFLTYQVEFTLLVQVLTKNEHLTFKVDRNGPSKVSFKLTLSFISFRCLIISLEILAKKPIDSSGNMLMYFFCAKYAASFGNKT